MRTINVCYKNQVAFAEFVREHKEILFSQENTSVLVQVFCGRNDRLYIKELVTKISYELPLSYIVGATTAGAIINGEVYGLETTIAITVFQSTVVRVKSFIKKIRMLLYSVDLLLQPL